jgi:hypothetical protein
MGQDVHSFSISEKEAHYCMAFIYQLAMNRPLDELDFTDPEHTKQLAIDNISKHMSLGSDRARQSLALAYGKIAISTYMFFQKMKPDEMSNEVQAEGIMSILQSAIDMFEAVKSKTFISIKLSD